MGEARAYEFDAVTIPSFESRDSVSSATDPFDNTVRITREMVYKLNCEEEGYPMKEHTMNSMFYAPTPPSSEVIEYEYINYDDINYEGSNYPIFSPQLMIIFGQGDLDCAMHFLMASVQEPFYSNAIATVLVEERLRDTLVDRVRNQIRPLTDAVARHPNYLATLEKLGRLNLEIIQGKPENIPQNLSSPLLVCDCWHSTLGAGPTGVICLHTFRSIDNAVSICRRESMMMATICIWNESIDQLYRLAASVDCLTFYFNCSNVSLEPIGVSLAAKKVDVCVVDGFHYETVKFNDKMKIIVFPVGAHLYQPNAVHVKIADVNPIFSECN